MDKDMMNIDDLFKQKMSEGEEKERPGAWLLMKDLLNDKMPVAVAVGTTLYNWRKIYSFFAGAAVIGSVFVGYKALHKAGKNAHNTAIAVNTPASTVAKVSEVAAAHSASATSAPSKSENTISSTQQNSTKSAVVISSNKSSLVSKSINKKRHNSLNINLNERIKSSDNSDEVIPNIGKRQHEEPKHDNSNGNMLASGTISRKPGQTSQQPKYIDATVTTSGNSKDNTRLNGTSTVPVPNTIASGNNGRISQPASYDIKDPHKTNPRYIDKVTLHDTGDVIVEKESVRRGQKTVVTTYGKIVRDYVLPETEENFYSHPVVAATSSSVDEQSLVSLNKSKVEGKYYKKSSSSNFFEEMVKNVKLDLSGVSFHSGLMMGINGSVGRYHMTGFQGGIAGMMNISDHWMMFAELKFIQRFGNGKPLMNNYNAYDGNKNYLGNNTFNYKWDSVEHYFNISSAGNIELPIAVRYSVRRVNVFGGLNTAYNFAINVEEKENRITNDYITTGSSTELTSKWNTDKPVIKTSDFGSRLTMGAMLGFGYQASPAIGLDLRITQPFWDNVRTRGAYEVSKELYRTPAFQFNMTYRLSNNKYKMR